MKQDLRVDIIDTEVPKPRPDQVLIRVVVSGCNPKDWYEELKHSFNHIYLEFF